MAYKAIIFDMNGTLIQDSNWHEIAWIEVSKSLRNEPLTVEEFALNCHGFTNEGIVTFLLGKRPSQETLDEIIERKEGMYRNMCLKNIQQFKLATGVIEFLDAVKCEGFPITIATGSYEPNVVFYFKHLMLGKWFNIDDVIYDDGTYEGKPKPYIYEKAARKLGVRPQECIVFEDSYSGIQAAFSAGIGRIFAVEPQLNKSKVAKIAPICKFINGFKDLKIEDILQN